MIVLAWQDELCAAGCNHLQMKFDETYARKHAAKIDFGFLFIKGNIITIYLMNNENGDTVNDIIQYDMGNSEYICMRGSDVVGKAITIWDVAGSARGAENTKQWFGAWSSICAENLFKTNPDVNSIATALIGCMAGMFPWDDGILTVLPAAAPLPPIEAYRRNKGELELKCLNRIMTIEDYLSLLPSMTTYRET